MGAHSGRRKYRNRKPTKKTKYNSFRSRGCGEEGVPGQTLIQGDLESKTCCGMAVSQTVSIRWFIVMIAFVGVCCSVVGTVLGAMRATGREHLTVSLLMIGEL